MIHYLQQQQQIQQMMMMQQQMRMMNMMGNKANLILHGEMLIFMISRWNGSEYGD